MSDGGAWASARVIGSGPHIYRTELSLRHDDRGPWVEGGCSCPIGRDCKHAAALALMLRAQQPWRRLDVAPDGRSSATERRRTSWRDALDELLDVPDPQSGSTPGSVGLLLDVETPTGRAARWDMPPPTPSIHLRPVVPGAVPGRWIRTGISWESVSGGYYSSYAHHLDGAPLDALTAIADAFRRSSRLSGYGRMPAGIPLGQVGRGWVELLTRARDAGIVLLHRRDRRRARCTSSPRSATSSSTCGRRAAVTCARCRASTCPATARSSPSASRRPAGSARRAPTCGSAGSAPTSTSPPPGSSSAARSPSRSDEWSTFAIQTLPVLQRRATVRTHDGLELPEVAPPRLHLAVRFAADHVVHLAWAFRYGPLDAPGHRAPRPRGGGAARPRRLPQRRPRGRAARRGPVAPRAAPRSGS